MRLSIIFALSIAISLQSCNGQTKKLEEKEFYNKDFNWTIAIPDGFEAVTPEQWAKMQNKGEEAMEKTYNSKIVNLSKTIFVFKSDQFNYFESNYQPFDSITDGNYLESCKNVNNILYGTFQAQIPNVKLDTISSEETIGGLKFQTFNVTTTFPNNQKMDVWMYSRLFGNKEFTVNIMTMDKAKQKLLFRAWRNSSFTKK